MIITNANDCTTISISDSLLEDHELGNTLYNSVTLYVKYNNGTEISILLDPSDISGGVYVLFPEVLSQTAGEPFCDGIYCFRLVLEDGTDLVTLYGNSFINCSISCSIAKVLIEDPTRIELYTQFEAIKYYQQCNSCDCDTLYALYENLLVDLDTSINLCGCK